MRSDSSEWLATVVRSYTENLGEPSMVANKRCRRGYRRQVALWAVVDHECSLSSERGCACLVNVVV